MPIDLLEAMHENSYFKIRTPGWAHFYTNSTRKIGFQSIVNCLSDISKESNVAG